MLLYFLTKGFSLTAIAGNLGRNKSTISMELKRNTGNSMYLPVEAQEKYHQRRRFCKSSKKLDTLLIYGYVKDKFLQHQWSVAGADCMKTKLSSSSLAAGANENINGLLREFFSKGQILTEISEEYIQGKVDELNKRSRKCLGYKKRLMKFISLKCCI